MDVEQMSMRWTESVESPSVRCESCGRPLDLWCEDCGCPVSCHDFIYPKERERLPYCLWDFGPCPREQRRVFLAAMDEWLCDRKQHLPSRSQAA
jgi:hypothetical protein